VCGFSVACVLVIVLYCIVDWVFCVWFYVGELNERLKIFFTTLFTADMFGTAFTYISALPDLPYMVHGF
jgi:hypothetical protein